MENVHFALSAHPLWILACLVAGALYAYVLYSKKHKWSTSANYALAGCRFILATAIFLLLLQPYIRHITSTEEAPLAILAVDNSKSIAYAMDDDNFTADYRAKINTLNKRLQHEGYETVIHTFDGPVNDIDDIDLTHELSDINSLLGNTKKSYEGRNVAGTILFSDGIYNRGISPERSKQPHPVLTVGVGDTTVKADIVLQHISANDLAYAGNKFPLVAEIQHTALHNKNTTVELYKGDKLIDQKEITLKGDKGFQEVKFLTSSDETGTHQYRIRVKPLDEEFNTDNNTRHAYIDIVDNKEKILLIAPSPHPDIKMLHRILSKHDKYELETVVLSHEDQPEDEDYALIIFHQIPHSNKVGTQYLKKYMGKDIPKMFFAGTQSDYAALSEVNRCVTFKNIRGQFDDVNGEVNKSFDLFKIDDLSFIHQAPPIKVPFCEHHLSGNAEVLLQQRIGKVTVEKPLVVFREGDDYKTGIVIGEGLWRWRMFDYLEHQSHERFDSFFEKFIQLMIDRKDRSKLRVKSRSDEYLTSTSPSFSIETYNKILEPVYDVNVSLKITSAEGDTEETYDFNTVKNKKKYTIKPLKEGVYHYSAQANINNENHTASGQFVVKKLQLEEQNLTADFNLMKQIAKENNGAFYTFESESNQIVDQLNTYNTKAVLHSKEKKSGIIEIEWLFFLLLALATLEWGTRKALGSY